MQQSDRAIITAMYASAAYRLKPKGSNITPPKKKRKKKPKNNNK